MDTRDGAFSLEQIIMAQVDEPSQKNCIYRLQVKAQPVNQTVTSGEPKDYTDKFIQIRVRSISYHEVDAVAIYFYDMTHHIESLKLYQSPDAQNDTDHHEKIASS